MKIQAKRGKKTEAKTRLADFLLDQVLEFVGDSKSPLKGGRWKSTLSKQYRSIKGSNRANLELSGDLLDSIQIKSARGNNLAFEIPGKQAGKAEGNDIGSYGRNANPSKAREFIPKEDKSFKSSIWSSAKALLIDEDLADDDQGDS